MKRRVTIMMVVLMTMVISAWAHDVNVMSNSHLVRDYQGSIMSLVDPSGYWHSDWSYPLYLYVVGIPSFLNAAVGDDHDLRSYERDANYRAFKYFNRNVNGFYVSPEDLNVRKSNWNFWENPINRIYGHYIDYMNKSQLHKAYDSVSLLYHGFIF